MCDLQEELLSKKAELLKLQNEIKNKIIILEDENQYLNNDLEICDRRKKLESDIIVLKKNRDCDLKLNVLKQDNEKLKKVYSDMGMREDINRKVSVLRNNDKLECELKVISDKMDLCNKKYKMNQDAIIKSKVIITKLESNDKYRIKIEELNGEIEILNLYVKCIDEKTGLPYKLAKKYIKILQENVNEILSKITNFTVSLNHDDKGGLSINVCDLDLNAMQMSGSQKFIIDLAIRLCLVKNHPFLPNFIIIDEGFGCMDVDHLNNTKEFLDSLNKYQDIEFIMIVSHIDELHYSAKMNLTISDNDGKSNLKLGDDSVIPDTTKIKESTIINDVSVIEEIDDGYKCLACEKKYKNINSAPKHLETSLHIKNYQKYIKTHKRIDVNFEE